MTLVVNNEQISEEAILSNYGDNIFDRYIKIKTETEKVLNEYSSDKLAIKVDLNVKIVKDKKDAKTTFRIASDGEEPVRIIKELKDTNLTHCYNQKRVREVTEDNLRRKGMEIKISQYDLNLICDKFDLKNNEKYYYKHILTGSWGCTQALIDFLTELFVKDTSIISKLREEIKSKK